MVQSVPDKIEIIFENSDFLIVSKPAGLLVHGGLKENSKSETLQPEADPPLAENTKQIPKPKTQSQKPGTLVDWLVEKYPEIKDVGDLSTDSRQANPLRPGIVHRLDKETSGVMVIAKNQETFELLKNKFKNREVKKTYLALVLNKMGQDSGEINSPIAKSKTSTKRTTRVRPGQKSSEAITNWKLLQTLADKDGNYFSFLEITPKTGRTHQIRVHLAAIGHPVCGDYLYGRKTTKSFREKLPRIFLHAKSLEFYWDKSFYSFEAELPDELKEFLASLVEINE